MTQNGSSQPQKLFTCYANTISPSTTGSAISMPGIIVTPKTALVTQITSITTAVTSNGTCGQIATYSAATSSGASSAFTFNDSYITASSLVFISLVSYSGTTGAPFVCASSPSAGSCTITLNNSGSAALNGVVTFAYLVI